MPSPLVTCLLVTALVSSSGGAGLLGIGLAVFALVLQVAITTASFIVSRQPPPEE